MVQYFQITADIWPIDWMKDGDRFLHLVDDSLKIALPSISGRHSSSQSSSETEPLHFRFGVTESGMMSELCAAPVPGGVYLFLRSEERITQEEILHWVEAVSSALRGITEDIPPVDWWAVIAASTEGGRQPALAAECTIDDLTLTPASSPYGEILPPQIPQLPQMSAGEVHERWPVIVHGVATAHSFDLARESAARRLGRLCALLSVATDHCWELLEAPRAEPLESDGLPRSRMPLLHPFPEPDESISVELPTWVGPSLDTFANDTSLGAALQAHHQGMMMERRFPSFAMIAYTAAIETIGARSLPDGEPGQQFREALKRIRTSKARQPFVKSYDLRSRTAHSGALHAAEDLHGSFPTGAWLPQVNTSWFFRLIPLGELRQASRELLTLGATGKLAAPLPGSQALNDPSGCSSK